jgi:hypothetical protein
VQSSCTERSWSAHASPSPPQRWSFLALVATHLVVGSKRASVVNTLGTERLAESLRGGEDRLAVVERPVAGEVERSLRKDGEGGRDKESEESEDLDHGEGVNE